MNWTEELENIYKLVAEYDVTSIKEKFEGLCVEVDSYYINYQDSMHYKEPLTQYDVQSIQDLRGIILELWESKPDTLYKELCKHILTLASLLEKEDYPNSKKEVELYNYTL